MEPTDRPNILGCPVDRRSTAGILEWIHEATTSGGAPRFIAVVNANKYYMMAKDERLRAIVVDADLVVPEWAIVWAAKHLGAGALEHSGGVLVARDFPAFAAERRLRPYYLGASREVVSQLVEKLRRDHPTLDVAGAHHGYLTSPDVEAEALADIERTRPDVLFVALGSPLQEFWIARHRDRLGVPVSIGVGGSFDVLSGAKHDTPDWARGHGLEWLYRLGHNPRAYWKRYLTVNSWFVWQVVKARWSGATAAVPTPGRSR